MVVIVFGLPGSGKSFFAQRLAEKIHSEYISSDKLRMEMYDTRTYSEEEKRSVYNTMLLRTNEALSKNHHVVLDATFHSDDLRRTFAEQLDVPIVFIEIRADESVVRERLKRPRTFSEADFEVYRDIKGRWDELTDEHLVLESTNNNVEEMLDKAFTHIRLRNDEEPGK
jgi:predicted kinase